MEIRSFGNHKGQEVFLYVLQNESIKVSVMNLGATLVGFEHLGSGTDIVLGFEDAQGYLTQHNSFLGATVGRCANRIGKGQFSLNGINYQVPVNNGPNSLHGGNDVFSFKVFEAETCEDGIVFRYVSEDGEEGYPGKLELQITYKLVGDELHYEIDAQSDADTICNITNHVYFNLDGPEGKDVLEHVVYVPADNVALNDADSLATDEVIDVKGTAFDFTKPTKVGDNLKIGHPNITLARGFDHNYVYEVMGDKLMATLSNGKLKLTVSSDLPDMHVYSGNWLDGQCKGKEDNWYDDKGGICFECQYYPNAINYDRFIKPILHKDEKMHHHIIWKIEEEK